MSEHLVVAPEEMGMAAATDTPSGARRALGPSVQDPYDDRPESAQSE